MELLYLINTLSQDECYTDDALFIKENTWFPLKRLSNKPVFIENLKAFEGNIVEIPICFRGKMEMKAGVKRDAYSFAWIYEKHLESEDWNTEICKLDISRFDFGELEISFLGLEDSVVMLSAANPIKKAIPDSQILYSFISPTYELCSEEQIYYKFSGAKVYYSFEDGFVHLYEDSSVDLLTYFNAFSVCKWHQHTNIRNLSAWIDFRGNADIVIVHKDEQGERCLCSYSVNTKERASFELPLKKYPSTGILGLRIFAREESILYAGGWLSPDPEVQHIQLGIGITTFKREDAVKASVARLSKDIANHPLYKDLIDITVVDNGQTLSPEDVPGANLVPNKNLGGTGGFTRSLIRYQESGRHTHCLFMDDDASCEASSIFRSMSFLRHAIDPKASLSGAMLFENIQFQQWENGAWFDGGCHSLNRDFDMRDENRLLENEKETDKKIYGAWWFFFFPLAEAKNYCLPFFVRGDDIDFSYSNDFKVLSLNGVSCWQQDFKTKENAMTAYLFLRSHVVHHLTIPSLKRSFFKVWKILWKHFRIYNNSYFYGTAACVNLALEHILQGPKFWEENIVPVEVLKKIKELSACEQALLYTEAEKRELKFADRNIKTRFFPAFLRKLSLNGHLFPRFMIRHTSKDMMYKWMTPNINRVYMRDQIIILDEFGRKKTVLKRNPKHYFRNLFMFIRLSITFIRDYNALREQYVQGTKSQRTREFWKKQFGE